VRPSTASRAASPTADLAFADAPAHFAALFAAGRPIVAVCASGIVVRALAPLLADKRAEPPVVALAEDGSVAVPLLGGHRGANALARRVAEALGGVAAVTTAGDLALGLALDDPPRAGGSPTRRESSRSSAALLAGDTVELAVESGDATWLASLPRGAARGSVSPIARRRRATRWSSIRRCWRSAWAASAAPTPRRRRVRARRARRGRVGRGGGRLRRVGGDQG
jgi:cobalt-precorrin 5A hydrolase/precorrin-3B C17-methyltransferase